MVYQNKEVNPVSNDFEGAGFTMQINRLPIITKTNNAGINLLILLSKNPPIKSLKSLLDL